MRTLFRNAYIFDGQSNVEKKGHVVVEKDRIVEVLQNEPENFEGETVDVCGMCLSPGFIDTHSHNDYYAVLPEADRYCSSFVMQGITTMIGGQCGFSTIGIDKDTKPNDEIFGFFAKNPNLENVTTFEDWGKQVDKYSPVNMACFCGHGTLKTAMLGLQGKTFSEQQFKTLERSLDDQLSAGALGLSFGLMYEPGIYSKSDELERLCKVVQRHDKIAGYHTRANSKVSMGYPDLLGRPHNLRAIDEVVEIAKKTGVKSNISHMIYVGRKTWPTLDESISLIDNANHDGCDISFDIYPFDFGASTIKVIMPPWYLNLSEQEKRNPMSVIRLYVEIFATKKLLGFGFEDIEIAWAGNDNKQYHGKRVSEIAKELGLGQLKTYLKLIEQCDDDATVIMYSYMNDKIIDVLSRHDKVSYMTDAWIVDNGIQNESCFSAFPKFLRLSRENKAEHLGDMICKMTGKAAERYRLKDRGYIKPGCFADLVVFDRQTISEAQTRGSKPIGIPYVMINGEFAVKDGQYLQKNLGKSIAVK